MSLIRNTIFCLILCVVLLLFGQGCKLIFPGGRDSGEAVVDVDMESEVSDGTGLSELHLKQMKISIHPMTNPCDRCHIMKRQGRRVTNKPIPQLCYNCHEDYKEKSKHVHGPVAVGACMFCHKPHNSMYVHLLKMNQPDLCTRCHEMEDYSSEVHESSADQLCTKCHDPHASSRKMFLKK